LDSWGEHWFCNKRFKNKKQVLNVGNPSREKEKRKHWQAQWVTEREEKDRRKKKGKNLRTQGA